MSPALKQESTLDRGGGIGGLPQVIDWLTRCIFGGRREQDLNKDLDPQLLGQSGL